ncbi:MAG: type I-PGING CRISPR-associated protein Cas8c/Csp2 [Bacteroidota bacterium]|jgi:CRISPR-associated protein Cas8c/Csp2|nr:type I-PGING CRISPR-associated protein Cas8c/Csp2 [Bacteroidota bacterium]HHU95727.1 type I-PGING CRISPR-associated protein Cas8c/Csp2 [Petrimonas sp.]
MNTKHPVLKYAQALILLENDLNDCKDISNDHLINEIEKGLQSFRVKPVSLFYGETKVKYDFYREEKGNPSKGVFLSPNVISSDKYAKNLWKAAISLINDLKSKPLDCTKDVTMAVAPTAGEYLNFSIGGKIGRGKPKSSLLDLSLSAITTLTKYKPCLQYRIDKIGQPEMFNVCLIPNLEIDKMKDFISFFKRMLISQTADDLMIGNVIKEESGKENNKKIIYSPKRPLIFRGNFPNPPRSSALGAIVLLGAIGEFAKIAEYSEQAKRVLESLKGTEIYTIKYGSADVFTYNHHVIDLAKESKLRAIIDSLYYSKLYNQDRRKSSNSEYQKFDLFTSRFLQLFNKAAFRDFLSFRAEYPYNIEILFTTYFTKMEKINLKIVQSAKILGKWLNNVAYIAAKNEVSEESPTYWEEINKTKAKVLVELESSIFSAKTGDALLAQAITRAGRLTGMDAPEGATLFMEQTASGELPLDSAKNLLIAFSRLRSKSEATNQKNNDIENYNKDEEDYSNE